MTTIVSIENDSSSFSAGVLGILKTGKEYDVRDLDMTLILRRNKTNSVKFLKQLEILGIRQLSDRKSFTSLDLDHIVGHPSINEDSIKATESAPNVRAMIYEIKGFGSVRYTTYFGVKVCVERVRDAKCLKP